MGFAKRSPCNQLEFQPTDRATKDCPSLPRPVTRRAKPKLAVARTNVRWRRRLFGACATTKYVAGLIAGCVKIAQSVAWFKRADMEVTKEND
jgi:hypothetical protein